MKKNRTTATALNPLQVTLRKLANSQDAQSQRRFFKTGPGEYGEGDVFIGVRVPEIRKIVASIKNPDLEIIKELLSSTIHEERLLALLLMVRLFEKGDDKTRADIRECYINNIDSVNNWDLVDSSAPNILGAYLFTKNKKPLYGLVKSSSMWHRRIAIMASFQFIKQGQFKDTLKLSKILLSDEHDLIHKAVGWMLREIGKRDLAVEEIFLKQHYAMMPRTMLRYAIEHFPETRRQRYLKGKV